MTAEEHKLMVWMFTKQAQYIKILIDLLKSKNVIEDGDLPPHEFVARVDGVANAELARDVATHYARFAKSLGLELSLPPQPPPPQK